MLEAIGLGLAKTLVTYLFKMYMEDPKPDPVNTIIIGGAPEWYEKRKDPKKLYAFAFADGDLSSLYTAKDRVKARLVVQLRTAMDAASDDKLRRLTTAQEKQMVQKMRENIAFESFVATSMQEVGLVYDDKQKRAYAGGSLSVEQIEQYTTNRLNEIRVELLRIRSDDIMLELDKEAS